MQFLLLLIERFRSENPKLFKIFAWVSGLTAIIIQCIFWTDSYFLFPWLTESWQGILNDIEFTAAGIYGTSQLTTKKKHLQVETEELLNKDK